MHEARRTAADGIVIVIVAFTLIFCLLVVVVVFFFFGMGVGMSGVYWGRRGSGTGGLAGMVGMRVRLSMPRPILWCIDMGASWSVDPGGVRLNAQMMFCIPSGGAFRVNAICGFSTVT